MPRRPEGPWWRHSRGQYFATIGGKQWPLGPDLDGARRRYHELMAGAAERARAESGSPSVRWLYNMLMAEVEARRPPATMEWYERHLGSFVERCGGMAAAEVRPHHVAAWLDAHRWGDTTRAGAVAAVKRAPSGRGVARGISRPTRSRTWSGPRRGHARRSCRPSNSGRSSTRRPTGPGVTCSNCSGKRAAGPPN
jgi:hypothetical protein